MTRVGIVSISDRVSVACNTLCRAHAGSKGEIANKGTDSNGEHHPAIISHEEQPKSSVRMAQMVKGYTAYMMKKL